MAPTTAPGGLIGSGLVPGGAVGNELAAITRRAFIPQLIVQLYQATPTLNLLMRTAQRARGGVGNITVPIQGASFVSAEWIGFGGEFTQPTDQTGIQDAAANLTVLAVPISFMGMESLVQATEVVVPRLKAKMVDIKNVAVQSLSTALFNFTTNPLQMYGLANAYDNGTGGTSIYANIDRNAAGNSYWQAQETTTAGAILNRSSMLKALVQTASSGTAGGEAPDLVIMSPPDWTTLMTDFLTLERYDTMPGVVYGKDDRVNTGFRAITLGDTAVVADLYCPTGTAYMINTKYYALYISDDARFEFSGFYSAIPNFQIANIGVMIVALQTLTVKPGTGRKLTGITGAAF